MDPVAGIEDCSCLVGKGISTGALVDQKFLRRYPLLSIDLNQLTTRDSMAIRCVQAKLSQSPRLIRRL